MKQNTLTIVIMEKRKDFKVYMKNGKVISYPGYVFYKTYRDEFYHVLYEFNGVFRRDSYKISKVMCLEFSTKIY